MLPNDRRGVLGEHHTRVLCDLVLDRVERRREPGVYEDALFCDPPIEPFVIIIASLS